MNTNEAHRIDSIVGGRWLHTSRTDPRVISLYRRHYSVDASKQHRNGISGPGQSMVMITMGADALFGWRDRRPDIQGVKDDGQRGIMCFVFRNESSTLSSTLITEADELAFTRWPHVRHFTYVDAQKTRRKRDPGRCFIKAGWSRCGISKGGLIILEKLPA